MTSIKEVGVTAFYAYLILKAGPDYVGSPVAGGIAGATASYIIYQTMGKKFLYG